jgi:hypothetical protein
MEIPKDRIVELIRERTGGDQASEAADELPDRIDPDRDAELLSKYGIDPQDPLGGGLGGAPGKLGL